MKDVLKTLRWVLAIVLCLIMSIIVAVTPYILSLSTFVTNRSNVLELINSSGIYENIDKLIIEKIESDISNSPEEIAEETKGNIQLSIDESRELFTSILTPKFARDTVEQAINSIYDYLEDKTDTPTIMLDKEPVKNAYFKTLVAAARRQMPELPKNLDLTKLPKCRPGVEDLDVKNLCLPANLDLDKKFDEITQQSGLGTDNDLIAIDLTKNSDIQFSLIKEIFFYTDSLPLILFISLTVLSLLIIALIPANSSRIIIPGVVGIIPSLTNTILFSIPSIFTDSPIFQLKTYVNLDEIVGADMIMKTNNWLIQRIGTNGLRISALLLVSFTILLIIGVIINIVRKRKVPTT